MSRKIYNALFFGTPEFAVEPLRTLLSLDNIKVTAVVTQPDRPVGKKLLITPPPVKIEARNNNLRILQPASIRSEHFVAQFRQLNPDVVVIVAYGKIIPEKILSFPKFGWLNVHASLLPKYRGASPIQAALLAGETSTGVTLMKIDSGLDTGPIIAQEKLALSDTDNSKTLHDKLSLLGSELLKKSLLPYIEGVLRPINQPNKSPTAITKIITRDDGKINWSDTAQYIVRQVQAYSPWPGTFCLWNKKRLKIIMITPCNGTIGLKPGQIKINQDKVLVGCGSGSTVVLNKIQLEGKKILETTEFLKGYPDFSTAKLQ